MYIILINNISKWKINVQSWSYRRWSCTVPDIWNLIANQWREATGWGQVLAPNVYRMIDDFNGCCWGKRQRTSNVTKLFIESDELDGLFLISDWDWNLLFIIIIIFLSLISFFFRLSWVAWLPRSAERALHCHQQNLIIDRGRMSVRAWVTNWKVKFNRWNRQRCREQSAE